MNNKELFKANIRVFEIEPHSYCNRKCWFCPNKFIDRTGPVDYFDPSIYLQVLSDLRDIDYSEAFCFAGWCEPWSKSEHTIRMIKQVCNFLPNANIFSNTNTDFIDTKMVKEAADAGLSVLKCQLYFGEKEEYTDHAIKVKMDKLKDRLPGIEFMQKEPKAWFALIGDLVIVAYSKDFRKVGHNRCGVKVREPQKRYFTCGESITQFGINYNGWVVPCCNIRSDYEPHKHVLLGRMDATPGKIFELYQGKLLQETDYPCSECTGKQWHANHKIVYAEILEELKHGK